MRYLLLLLCLLLNVARADLSVVTSIPPLYQITAAIMQGAGSPELLIKDEHSAHHFSFKPSHFRTLQQANLVIWIDRQFESGFQRLPEILPAQTYQLEILPALGMKNQDGHIWYSPKLLIEMSHRIAAKLAELDADNQHIYSRNQNIFEQQISQWRQSVDLLLSKNRPLFLLDHSFLHHFEDEFGIKPVAVIHNSHGQHRGIKALQLIEQQLKQQSVRCLISNEAHISSIGKSLARQFSLSTHSIKTYANEGDVAARFISHLQHLTEILRGC
jgi:zinc transport system substrate-binding protein